MPPNTQIFLPRAPIYGGRGRLMTHGYTPIPLLYRATEAGDRRITEEGHNRVSERNTVTTP